MVMDPCDYVCVTFRVPKVTYQSPGDDHVCVFIWVCVCVKWHFWCLSVLIQMHEHLFQMTLIRVADKSKDGDQSKATDFIAKAARRQHRPTQLFRLFNLHIKESVQNCKQSDGVCIDWVDREELFYSYNLKRNRLCVSLRYSTSKALHESSL